MKESWTPTAEDIAALFATLRTYPRLILAVSGGSDSMALLHLAVRWAKSIGADAPQISVAIVDHGLRSGSRDEAQSVSTAVRALGLEAAILTCRGPKPEQGVQEWAREKRYELLASHAAAQGSAPCAIVTAHTRDDQAETLLMRLARGSGPDGLQGMRLRRRLTSSLDVFVVRPLLTVSRAELRSFLSANGVDWIDDPSNQDPRFERVRLRGAAHALHGVGLTPKMLALAAQRQQRAVAALEAATDDLAAVALNMHLGAFASLHTGHFRNAPAEIAMRLLGRVLTMFGGLSPPAELAQVERLALALCREPTTRVTLGGCEIRACERQIRVFREPGRAVFPILDLDPGDEAIWDNRFHIRLKPDALPMTVRCLDAKSAEQLRRQASSSMILPARAAATLPSIWSGDALVAVGGLPAHLFNGSQARAGAMVEMRFLYGSVNAAA
jgi:tRNA(Ile)-lysidine synthase